MKTESQNAPEFHSLNDIRKRKEMLLADIREDDRKIKEMWRDLFKKPDALSSSVSPSKRIASIITNSMGLIDGAILGWKLYRKFKKYKR